MSILRPRTGTELRYDLKPSYPSTDGCCNICGDYDGFHARCWWSWLTEERVIRGYHDGEQQIEPDEPYPSRWWIVRNSITFYLDPRGWLYHKTHGLLP